MKTLFLIFNHQLTNLQAEDARAALGVDTIVNLPAELQELWSNVPPELPEIKDYLKPIEAWLSAKARAGDYALIQGGSIMGRKERNEHFKINRD